MSEVKEIAGFKFKDETAREEINKINAIISNLKNNNHIKMIMIGDSFGVLNSDNDITKFYWEYVRDGLGLSQDISFFSLFQSGAGFGNGNFITNLQTIANTVSKEEITDIFVSGGWNDKDTTITNEVFDSAIETFNNYVKTNLPNARVTIAHISWGNVLMKNDYEVFQQLPVTQARYKKACNKYGWRYLTGVENILHIYDSSYWQSDGTHPNQKGQERLGTNLVAPFLTGSCNMNEVLTSSPTPSGIATAISTCTTFNYLNNETVQVCVTSQTQNQDIIITCNNQSIPANGNFPVEIGKLNSPFLAGFSSTNAICVPCVLYGVIDGSDNSFNCQASIFVDRGTLFIKPLIIGGKTIKTISISAIHLTDFKFINPTIIS